MKVLTNEISYEFILSSLGLKGGDKSFDIKGFFTDSREVFEGGCFVALRGERVNGADFIPDVLSKGACLAISADLPEGFDNGEGRVIIVDDSVEALARIASCHRERLKGIKIAAVTGSVGKTTTKEMIYAVISNKYKCHKTSGNHNSNIGLPISMFALDDSYGAAVYEMGMSGKGEISAMTSFVRPDVAVITNIGNMHIEYLGSREGIRDAKMEIREGLSEKGELILNGDEPLLSHVDGATFVSFDNPSADGYIYNVREGEEGTYFDYRFKGETVSDIYVPAVGLHNVQNAAMAYGVGKAFGMTEDEIKEGLQNFRTEGMRQRFYRYKDVTILEDCYNAGPESMRASLSVLKSYCIRNGKRGVAVMGEMKELGDHAPALHYATGKFAAECCQLIFAVGNTAFCQGAVDGGLDSCAAFDMKDMAYSDIAVHIVKNIRPDDCILFKGSRSMHLETLIEEIKKIY